MAISPAHNYLLVKVDRLSGKKGKLYLPESSTQPGTGTVLAYGPGVWDTRNHEWIEPGFVKNERVMFYPGMGIKHSQLDEDVILINANDILGTIEE
jgi:co-chaperonin GroES (HSP10)